MREGKPIAKEWVQPKSGVVPEIYCNFVNSSWTLFDVRVRLGQLVPREGEEGFVVEERAAVTFSWNEAKIMRDMLAQLVEAYEKVNGEIKQPRLAPDPTESAREAGTQALLDAIQKGLEKEEDQP